MRLLILISALLLGLSFSANAGIFSNPFTEFELPAGFSCQQNGPKWVCQNSDPKKKEEAYIHVMAKTKDSRDTLDQYLEKLKTEKGFKISKGLGRSLFKYAKIVNYNGQAWVEALHQESELPGYYTYYLETVIQDIAVLIGISIDMKKYDSYADSFKHLFETVKVFRTVKPLTPTETPSSEVSPDPNQSPVQGEMNPIASSDGVFGILTKQSKKNEADWGPILLFGGVGVLGVLLWIWKHRKK